MVDERQSGAAERSAIGFGVGLVLGMAAGVGIGVLVAPKNGASFRRELGARARRLCDDAALLTREAGRQMAAAREPDRSALAGVEGLSDPL